MTEFLAPPSARHPLPHQRTRNFLLAMLFASCAGHANAANEAGVSSGTYIQTLFGLLLVVALIAGLAWYARKLSVGQAFGKNLVRVVGGVALGPRERIVLVEVGDEWLVIGLVPGQIRTLHKCPKGELPAPPDGLTPPFSTWLKQTIEKRNKDA